MPDISPEKLKEFWMSLRMLDPKFYIKILMLCRLRDKVAQLSLLRWKLMRQSFPRCGGYFVLL